VTRTDIELREDPDRPGSWEVLSDGVRQSYVDLVDPTRLVFDYARAISAVLEGLPAGPLEVVHVGGAACTLGRYVAATRPGSAQVVLDPDEELTRLVLDRLPLPEGADVRMDAADGRTGVAATADASVDAVVVDALAEGRVPAALTTTGFVAEAARVLRPGGVLVIDVVSAPDHDYARRVAASVRQLLPHVLVVGFPTIVRGLRFGNVVVAGSAEPLAEEAVRDAALRLEQPQLTLTGADVDDWVDGAVPLTDADPARSPRPPRMVHRPR
jgi:spermidine synthase